MPPTRTLRPGDRLTLPDSAGGLAGMELVVKSIAEDHAIVDIEGLLADHRMPLDTLAALTEPPAPPPALDLTIPTPEVLRARLLAIRDSAPEGSLNPPASAEALDAFAARVGGALPASFRILYETFDGSAYARDAGSADPKFDDGERLASLEDMLREREMWTRIDAEDRAPVYGPGVFFRPSWIPFVIIASHALVVLDTAASEHSPAGAVLSFGYKDGGDRSLCFPSFDAWLMSIWARHERGHLFRELTYEERAINRELDRAIRGGDAVQLPLAPLSP